MTKTVETCAPVKLRHNTTVCVRRKDARPSAPMKGPGDVCRYLRGASDLDREHFYALHLNTRNQVIGAEEVAKGVINGVEVHPREAFKSAILNNAAGVIFAHNHPSGNPEPSTADIELTKRLAEGGRLLGIPVHDHVVVGDVTCRGLRDTQDGASINFGTPTGRKGAYKPAVNPSSRAEEKDQSYASKKALDWFVGGLLATTIGGVLWWKWNQISSSGVPLNFAMRRTFSKRFFEGYLGLQNAWEQKQKKAQKRMPGQQV